jgi:uncharacterized membrane-anchored protein YitT (DUF2179 family)
MKKQRAIRSVFIDLIYIVIGCAITAMAMTVFLIPFKISPGGFAGFATVVFHLTDGKLPVGLVILAVNIPLFIIGIKSVGGRFLIKTLLSTVLFSVLIDVLSPYTQQFVETYLWDITNSYSNANLMLYCIFGGALVGVGLGLVFKAGSSTGGTDLAAQIIHKILPQFTVGVILLVIDGLVVLFAAIAYRSFLLGLYATVTIFITSKVVDTIIQGIQFSKAVFIISNYPDEISDRIMSEIDRGVTGLNGTGMYTKSEKKVLMCVLQRTQIPRLKRLVKEVDPKAFIVTTDVREVLGEGF